MAEHTPTPWLIDRMNEFGNEIVGDNGRVVDTMAYAKGTPRNEVWQHRADYLRKVAAVNAFHSDDGREIPTEAITQGLFWEMRDLLAEASYQINDLPYSQIPFECLEAIRALLAKLEPQK